MLFFFGFDIGIRLPCRNTAGSVAFLSAPTLAHPRTNQVQLLFQHLHLQLQILLFAHQLTYLIIGCQLFALCLGPTFPNSLIVPFSSLSIFIGVFISVQLALTRGRGATDAGLGDIIAVGAAAIDSRVIGGSGRWRRGKSRRQVASLGGHGWWRVRSVERLSEHRLTPEAGSVRRGTHTVKD